MAIHNDLGKNGEEAAALFLTEKGYHILHRNWRSGKKELDIVAEYQGELVIIEVKTRRFIICKYYLTVSSSIFINIIFDEI